LKRFLHFILACVLCISMLLPAAAFAAAPEVSTPYICLMDANTGAVLYEKAAREKAYPASTTKIMTCILAIEMCEDLNEVVNVGSGFDTAGSLMNFVRGEELRVIDLIYGTMMVSGNDAAYALATHIGGSESNFANLMNQKAAEIGMNNTHFVKSNGLHKDDHYSTAYDMALLGRYAMQNPKFREVVGSEYFDVPASQWDSDGYHLENSNRLIHTMETDDVSYKYAYATGIKTGDTNQAGRCLVASAQKNGVELILVLFGDPQGSAGKFMRFENAPKFFEWGFENYASVSISELGLETSVSVPVSNASFEGSENGLTATATLPSSVLAGTKDFINDVIANKANISYTYALNGNVSAVTAPIAAGDNLGTITYTYNGAALLTGDLIAANSVDEIGNVMETAPTESPILSNEEEEGGSGLLFWILIIIALLALLLIIRIALTRKARRRRARNRRSSYSSSGRPRSAASRSSASRSRSSASRSRSRSSSSRSRYR